MLRYIRNTFSHHSEKVTSLSYFLATTTLLVKNIDSGGFIERLTQDFQTQMDVSAAIPFYVSSISYYLAEKNPKLFIKIAGGNVLIGSILLGIGGYRGSFEDISFWIHLASMLPTTWAGAALLCEKRSLGVIPELISRPFHAIAGLAQNDIGQVIFSIQSAIGEIGLIATDRKLKNNTSSITE